MKLFLPVLLLIAHICHADEPLELKPLTTKVAVELGQFIGGKNTDRQEVDMQSHVERRILFLMGREIVVNETFSIHIGLGGALFYFFPVDNTQYFTKGTRTALTLGYGYGRKNWDWGGSLQFGIFHVKYNAQAKNLGEYLFRSGTYPSLRYTGGYSNINTAMYPAEGFKFSLTHFNQRLRHDFMLFSERYQVPTVDFTPSYVFSFKLSDFLEIGGGVAFNRYIPVKPSKLSPKTFENSYVKVDPTTPLPQLVKYGEDTVVSENVGPLWLLDLYEDVATGNNLLKSKKVTSLPNGQTISEDAYKRDTCYYTQKGIKLMGRAVVHLPANASLYGEVALLGIDNYPFYYESRKERMPVMAGVSLPTLGTLDNLSFEMEYLKAKYANDIQALYNTADPIWNVVSMESMKASLKQAKREKWKWSIFAEKTINKTMKAYLQVASDHFRTIDYERRPSHTSVIKSPNDWYYMGKFEYGF